MPPSLTGRTPGSPMIALVPSSATTSGRPRAVSITIWPTFSDDET
jgi:hypothetical protein